MPILRQRAARAGSQFTTATRWVVTLPFVLARVLGRQLYWTASNARGFLGWLTIDRALPPAIASTLKWLGQTIPKALGLGETTSYQQTAAASVLLIGAATTTILLFGLGATLIVVMGPFLLLGLIRFNPIANSLWTAGRRRIPSRDDLSRPRWDR